MYDFKVIAIGFPILVMLPFYKITYIFLKSKSLFTNSFWNQINCFTSGRTVVNLGVDNFGAANS